MNKLNLKPLIFVCFSVITFLCFLWMITNFGYELLGLTYKTASDIRSLKAVFMQIFIDTVAILIAVVFFRVNGKNILNIGFNFNKKIILITVKLLLILLFEYLTLIAITTYWGTAEWQLANNLSIRFIIQAVIVFFMIGTGEEILFRGYIFKNLLSYGRTTAYILSSLLFAIPHFIDGSFNLVRLITLMVLAVFFAYIYEKTGSIVPGIIVHSMMDLVGFFVIKNKTGISLLKYTGSIQVLKYLSIMAIVIQFFLICYNYKKKSDVAQVIL